MSKLKKVQYKGGKLLDMTTVKFPWIEIPKFRFNRLKQYKAEIKFKVTRESTYISEDQGDWLKAGGISFNLISNNKYAALLGLRYNAELDHYECTPYINYDNGKIDFNILNPLTIDFDVEYSCFINVKHFSTTALLHSIDYHIIENNSTKSTPLNYHVTLFYNYKDFKIGKFAKEVGNYAGGDKRPSNKFSWYQSFTFLNS